VNTDRIPGLAMYTMAVTISFASYEITLWAGFRCVIFTVLTF